LYILSTDKIVNSFDRKISYHSNSGSISHHKRYKTILLLLLLLFCLVLVASVCLFPSFSILSLFSVSSPYFCAQNMREILRKLHKQRLLVKIESRKMLLIARIHIILRKLTAARNYFRAIFCAVVTHSLFCTCMFLLCIKYLRKKNETKVTMKTEVAWK
jgi:hypothetical protein